MQIQDIVHLFDNIRHKEKKLGLVVPYKEVYIQGYCMVNLPRDVLLLLLIVGLCEIEVRQFKARNDSIFSIKKATYAVLLGERAE